MLSEPGELAQLATEINRGSQNRQGEIEYELPTHERIRRLEVMALLLLENLWAPKQSQDEGSHVTEEIVGSMIYWALLDQDDMVEALVRTLGPMAHLPIIGRGFASILSSSLSLDARERLLRKVLAVSKQVDIDSGPLGRVFSHAYAEWPQEEQESEPGRQVLNIIKQIN